MNCPYIAFLRGINVSGSNLIKMESLKSCLEKAGFTDVQTYIQSGNILFYHNSKRITELGKLIHLALEHDFGFKVIVIVKTLEELEKVVDQNPFLPEMSQQLDKLHVTFLESTPDNALIEKIQPLDRGVDRGVAINDCIYLYCPGGYGRTLFTNTYFEKKLRMNASTRNWKTIIKMIDLAMK